jgi:hypothetical protein
VTDAGQSSGPIELPPMPLPPELPPDDEPALDRAAIEREVRAKIRAEVEAARERYAPGPSWASPYRRGVNLALLVISGDLDKPLSVPLSMGFMEISGSHASAEDQHPPADG